MNNAFIQNVPKQHVLHLLMPYHTSNGEMLLAIGAKHRCTAEGIVSGNELAALTRVIDALTRAASPPANADDVWAPIPVQLFLPHDLAVEDLLLAETISAKLKDKLPQFEAEAVEKLVKTLANAYHWEIGEGPAPEPVIPADACADLVYDWIETYLVYRWTNRDQGVVLSAPDLAKLAAQHFGVIEEEDDPLPFVVIAQDVMRFYPRSGGHPTNVDEEEA